jgi:uncharacterized coiled-coil protein SlyX
LCVPTSLQLQSLLQKLDGAHHLVHRVFDLEKTNKQQEATISKLEQQLAAEQHEVVELREQLHGWQGRGTAAEQEVDKLQGLLRLSTPRPHRDLGLLADMLTEEEGLVVEGALVEGTDYAAWSSAHLSSINVLLD